MSIKVDVCEIVQVKNATFRLIRNTLLCTLWVRNNQVTQVVKYIPVSAFMSYNYSAWFFIAQGIKRLPALLITCNGRLDNVNVVNHRENFAYRISRWWKDTTPSVRACVADWLSFLRNNLPMHDGNFARHMSCIRVHCNTARMTWLHACEQRGSSLLWYSIPFIRGRWRR